MTIRGPEECPKCGAGWSNGLLGGHYGDAFDGPHYKATGAKAGGECLEFRCKECGYVHVEPTKDQKAKA